MLRKKIFISLILIIDSKFLYDCLIRLEIIVEKRLMMNVMILRQFYKRREIIEMKWMHETNNLVDFMIKSKSSSTLKTMIDINQINLNITEWVEQAMIKKTINQMTKRNVQINENVQIDEWNENSERNESKKMIFNFSKRFECWY